MEKFSPKHIPIICFLFLSLFFSGSYAGGLTAPGLKVEIHSVYGGGKQLPFWLLANQYGKYDTEKAAILSTVGIFGKGDGIGKWDFQYGMEGIGRINQGSATGWLHQAFGKAEYRKFLRIQAGVWEETFGNQYTPLSSGSIIWSQNARPMPKVEMGSAGFIDVPFTKGILQVKGALAHGWFEKDRHVEGVWLHHKYAAARTQFNFPLNINFAFHHFAMWGGKHPVFGQLPNDFDAYVSIFLAGKGGEDAPVSDQLNRAGNHIGSRHYGIDWQQPGYALNFYFQDIFEDGSGARWKNFPDGLWGVVWKNSNTAAPVVAVLYEYLQTTDQSGPVHQAVGLPGDDNYFNHGTYQSGWTHHLMTLGTPFITSPVYNQDVDHPANYRIWNNRVQVHHVGVHGKIIDMFSIVIKGSYAHNFGLHTSMEVPDDIFYFKTAHKQWHWILDLSYEPRSVLRFNFKISSDRGRLHGDNLAAFFGLKYVFM